MLTRYSFLPSLCGERMLFKNQWFSIGEKLLIESVFLRGEHLMTHSLFMRRISESDFKPAGQIHAQQLIEDGIEQLLEEFVFSECEPEYEPSVLAFPGTVYTLREKFYDCFCVPVLARLGEKWLPSALCSRKLIGPDVHVVFTNNLATTH